MAYWLDEYPPLRVMSKSIAADDFNRIRLGLLRMPLPWRIPLKEFRCLHCVLDETAWVCIDECYNNLPVLAWTKFKIARRAALDTPIECELHLFHMHAGLLMGAALEALATAVTEHCRPGSHDHYPLSVLEQDVTVKVRDFD